MLSPIRAILAFSVATLGAVHQAVLPHAVVEAALHADILAFLEQALVQYGYIIVFLAICIESMGVPFPGETMLLIGAAYAANTHNLDIYGVIACAAGGAIVGDSIGYWVGREGGSTIIHKYGRYVGLTEERYKKGQEYLHLHGGKAVFWGRFVAVARTWIAVLVGAHHVRYSQFLLYNVLGGIVWATVYGSLGYLFGENLPLLEKWIKTVGIGFTLLAVAAAICFYYLRKRRKRKLATPADSE